MIVYDENENRYEGPIVATDDVKPDAIVFVNFNANANANANANVNVNVNWNANWNWNT